MVDCSTLFAEYSELRDGLLEPARRVELEQHLRHCPSCARYDRVVRAGVDVVHALPELEPSDDFLARLERRIRLEDAELALGGSTSGASLAVMVGIIAALGAIAWTPLARPRVAVVELPPVAAHAPHRVEAVHDLFRPGPLLSREAAPAAAAAGATLLFRYSPLGAAEPATLRPVMLAH